MKNNFHEQDPKIQKVIEHDLQHDASYITDDYNDSLSDDSNTTPLLSNQSISANTEFNPINYYFSDDSEELVLRRKSSAHQSNMQERTPMIPYNFQDEEVRRRKSKKQRKHEIHQKVRGYKLLLKVVKILKWCILLMLCASFLPLSMFSIVSPGLVIAASALILLSGLVHQIYTDNRKYGLFEINLVDAAKNQDLTEQGFSCYGLK